MKDKENLKSAKALLSRKIELSPKAGKELFSEAHGKTCFAFDFGEYAIKIAVGKPGRNSVSVRQLILIENDENLTRVTSSNVKDWRAKITRTLNLSNISTSGQVAFCSLPGRSCISRNMEIPFASNEDLQGIVSYNMSQNLSLDPDAYSFQYRINNVYEKNGVKMCSVWAAAIQREQCDAYFDLLDSMKLKPLAMDINVNGFERFIANNSVMRDECSGRVIAAIDYGMRGTDISIYRNGEFVQVDTISNGDGILVSAVKSILGMQVTDIHNSNKLVVSPQEVYNILTNAKDSEEAANFLELVSDWLNQISGVISKYDIEHPDEKVSRAYLYGGSPQVLWLKHFLNDTLNIPVSFIQSSDLFEFSDRINTSGTAVSQFLNALNQLIIK